MDNLQKELEEIEQKKAEVLKKLEDNKIPVTRSELYSVVDEMKELKEQLNTMKDQFAKLKSDLDPVIRSISNPATIRVGTLSMTSFLN
jgi:seryl-tRNA synthetase